VSTVEYKINFLNPALLNDQLKAIAKVEQKQEQPQIKIISDKVRLQENQEVEVVAVNPGSKEVKIDLPKPVTILAPLHVIKTVRILNTLIRGQHSTPE
jgi:hypothetical protein